MTDSMTSVPEAVAALGARPVPVGNQPQPLDLERVRKTAEIATTEAATMAASGESLPHGIAALVDDVPALLAEVQRLKAELASAQEDSAFLQRNTLPELRRAVEHHQDGKKRWRERAQRAEARVAELESDLARAVAVSEALYRRLSQEQLAGSALHAALTMPTTPEQRQAALDKFRAVAQQVTAPAEEA
ncbi:hypothetical protein ACIG0D_27550 [Streptomyces sp. NPDC052773]|uniref:hypothetical protein n=1 Tax=Streptomyces sp. NPDC052773 TaxID=3365693 RepID=UPI0037D2DF49